MPWFYAGPDAKPVGPLSLEELQARRLQGAVTPETYVIEQTPSGTGAWKRYRELFPAVATLPPVPPPAPPVVPAPAVPIAVTTPPAPHPLFPSAPFAPAPAPTYTPVQLTPAGRVPPVDPHAPIVRTNPWCAWGFGLGLGSVLGLFACGIGVLLAPFGFVVSIVGLARVRHHREEAGRGMAIAGVLLSSFTLLLTFIVLLSVAIPMIHTHERTATEETTNDSE